MSPRRRAFSEKLRSLYLWHRYAGLAAALLAAWLAVTGILLNHTEDFELTQRPVQQRWLQAIYNVDLPRELHGQQIAGHWLTETGGRIYLDDTFIGKAGFAAATETDFGFAVAFTDRLLLFTPDATLVEEMPFLASEAPITGIANREGKLLLSTTAGQFLGDADVTRFVPAPARMKAPSPQLEALPAQLVTDIGKDVAAHALDWERVMLDLHSGRLLGKAGKWLADAAGGLLLLLAVTGVVVWWQRARARRRHR